MIMFKKLIACAVLSTPLLAGASETVLTTVPTIDGVVDASEWASADVYPLDIETLPGGNVPAKISTVARIIDGGDKLYVSFVAAHPEPDKLRSQYGTRDYLYNDELIGIMLDPFNDRKFIYKFYTNALGVQIDGVTNEAVGGFDGGWDALWQSKGRITSTGYEVEMSIPYSALNFVDNGGVKTWGLQFLRNAPLSEAVYRLSNVELDLESSCDSCNMIEVTGFKNASAGENLVVTPNIVTIKNDSRDIYRPNSPYESNNSTEFGLDVKWGVTGNSTLNATYNPDFSTIEADAGQLSVNKTYSLYYEEKRPFFLENGSYFDSPMELVYTRNIADPDFGIKYTGRTGDHTYGMFIVNDDLTNVLMPGEDGSYIDSFDSGSTNAVVRYRNEVSDNANVGLTSTLRKSDNYHNYVVALDTTWELNDAEQVIFQMAGSETLYAGMTGGEELNGTSSLVRYELNNMTWSGHAAYYSIDEDFRADLGYVPSVNKDGIDTRISRTWLLDSLWYEISMWGAFVFEETSSSETLKSESTIGIDAKGPYLTYLYASYSKGKSSTLPDDLSRELVDVDSLSLYATIQPFSWVEFGADFVYENTVDYYNNVPGELVGVTPFITITPSRNVTIDITHSYSKLDNELGHVFTANLSDIRLGYHYDLRHSLKVSAIYSDVERNTSNYAWEVDENSSDLGLQATYSYTINPQTAFYLGYSDISFSDDQILKLKKSESTFYAKVTYAFSM
jgi:hypothetical protein